MATAEQRLEELKNKMTNRQRADMAEIITNEIKRREVEKEKPKAKLMTKSQVTNSKMSGSLDSEEIGQMYNDTEAELRQLRLKKLEQQINGLRSKRLNSDKNQNKVFKMQLRSQGSILPAKGILLMYTLIAVGAIKILFSTGLVSASVTNSTSNKNMTAVENTVKAKAQLPTELQGDKELLVSLDTRRVELEERKLTLDKREQEIATQAQVVNERLAELKSISAKLNAYRTEKDQKHEARLEQLAEVYGSMAPNQAAPLIGKLDDLTALSLLQRMSGKRVGQILSSMESDRAIELTKLLTDRKKVE